MESLEKYNHVDLLFPSKYLKSVDLKGKHVRVTIEEIDPRSELQMVGGKKSKKPVVYLKGKEKAWVLNKTNAQALAQVYGPEVMKWVGKEVVLMPAKANFGGKEVDALRVDIPATFKLAPASDPEPAHDPTTGEVTEGATGTDNASYAYAEDKP